MLQPIYTAENCRAAYQLRWSLALFEDQPLPHPQEWQDRLSVATEPDGVRLLEVEYRAPKTWMFLLSTQPKVFPSEIVKSVKGRLQKLLRPVLPQAFQRNFSLTSVGDANDDMTRAYVAGQVEHHSTDEMPLPAELLDFQWQNPEVDLSVPQFSSHGRYITNLHLVLQHAEPTTVVDSSHWLTTREMIRRVTEKKRHWISNVGLLPDHLHLFVGILHSESPESVALTYLNNLAYAHGMQPIYSPGYYSGTIGPYHMQAIRRRL